MKYTIYQIPDTTKAMYCFLSYGYAINYGFDLNDYEVVYEGDIDCTSESLNSVLEKIFTILNSDCSPFDYNGRSLSMSDIVKVDGKYFYCDTVGWKKIGED